MDKYWKGLNIIRVIRENLRVAYESNNDINIKWLDGKDYKIDKKEK